MKKIYYSWNDIERQCQSIVNQIAKDKWLPDYVVGITRGGNVPATLISHMLNVRCESLKVALRDGNICESNYWMAEDAFGVVHEEDYKCRWDVDARKNILVVDDINDSGDTLDWIQNDWSDACLAPEYHAWETVWKQNVRFSTLVHNIPSKFNDLSYFATKIDKSKEPCWIVFPWECVGEYRD